MRQREVLDPTKGRIIEANPAAKAMFRTGTADVTGRPLSKLFGTDNLAALQSRTDGIHASDGSDDMPKGVRNLERYAAS